MITIRKQGEFDILGIGSPLMDIIVQADDAFLERAGLKKGLMTLVDDKRRGEIVQMITSMEKFFVPGGSASNTVAGAALLGSRAAFIGSIGRDEIADTYRTASQKAGVSVRCSESKAYTGCAYTFITPDGERTFATYLGAALDFNKDGVDLSLVESSRILHIEGYLFDGGAQFEAAVKAMDCAKKNGGIVSIDLSDPWLVERSGDDLRRISKEYADILFMNEEEAKVFTGKAGEESAIAALEFAPLIALKLGAAGSVIATKDSVEHILPFSVKVVNTNGAGDMYAGGFLYAFAKEMPLKKAGTIASYVSSRVVASLGARLNARPDIESL